MQPDHAVDGTREKIDNHTEHGDDGQHLDRWETHLSLAADVVADEVTRTQEELHHRVEQRAIVHTPHLGNTLAHTAPRDGSQTRFLRAIGAKVSHKLMSAISAMLRVMGSELMIVRVLLPMPELPVCFLNIHCCYLNRQIKYKKILYIGVSHHPYEKFHKEFKPIDKIGFPSLYHVNAEVDSQHQERYQVGTHQCQNQTP